MSVSNFFFFSFFHFFSLFFLPDAERRAVGCSRVAASAAAVSQLPRLCITYYSKYPRQPPNQLRETRISFVKPGARADGRSIVLLLRNLELSESRLQRQSRESERERERSCKQWPGPWFGEPALWTRRSRVQVWPVIKSASTSSNNTWVWLHHIEQCYIFIFRYFFYSQFY